MEIILRLKTGPGKRAHSFLLLLLILCQLFLSAQKKSSLWTPHIFSDNMVLQQGINTTIWGSAENAEKVIIDFSGTKTTAVVSKKNGGWIAKLPVFSAGGPFEMKISVLYLAARKVAYHEDIVTSGPEYHKIALEGNKIRISFTSTAGG